MYNQRNTLSKKDYNGPGSTRKSRAEGKSSFIPRPAMTRQNSSEKLTVGWKPFRSTSVEHSKPSFGGRTSRDVASSSKHSLVGAGGRSKSQSNDPYMTPLRNMVVRHTTTPQRTPSSDRSGRNWQKCMERVLACVTVKDKRVISSAAWQRSELPRIQAALGQLASPADNSLVLIKPLTIGCFVNIVSALLEKIVSTRYMINASNYVNKLPHATKKLLYPGVVSKSWLKTVNTPHTFPHALALIGYQVDLANRLTSPVSPEWLYAGQDEASKLFFDYLRQCCYYFKESLDTDPADNAYLESMRSLLSVDESKIEEIKHEMEELRAILDDPSDQAARAEEARQSARLEELREAIRCQQREQLAARERAVALERRAAELEQRRPEQIAVGEGLRERLSMLDRIIAQQDMTSEQMDRVLEHVNEVVTVNEGKRNLLNNIMTMTESADSKLQAAKKAAMDNYVRYNHKLIELGSDWHCPDFVIDDRSLAEESTVSTLRRICETLSSKCLDMQTNLQREVVASAQRVKCLGKLDSQLKDMKVQLRTAKQQREETLTEYEVRMTEYREQIRSLRQRTEQLRTEDAEYETTAAKERAFLDDQDVQWRTKLSELAEARQKQHGKFKLAVDTRIALAQDVLTTAAEQLQRLDNQG